MWLILRLKMSCFSHQGVLGGGGGGGGGSWSWYIQKLQGKKSKITIAPPLHKS